MKKAICMILVMVIIAMVANTCMASGDFNRECECEYCQANRVIYDWAERQENYERYVNDSIIGDTHFYIGVLNKRDWSHYHDGKTFDLKFWLDESIKENHFAWLDISIVGESEGKTIYRVTGEGDNNEPARGEQVKCIDVIFIAY